ncbi:CRISPR-associated endonuclease Cas1 [Candidatus Accumulibacter phosphatis]|uniref:CRISPR-associated endonuclease Cas1 n=1 Tax=Candidatus Accumulibacter phosphatis TaxID=327160 RepID=A0A5S4EPB4_9PROT|nr:CRISPR-associated endonuclease Cas1 [Candidatus Accumulibacter phosphatis]TMQ77172.1 CRISPR-associated protein Cas1 [Candidatus Accumulibacter phosphatis]
MSTLPTPSSTDQDSPPPFWTLARLAEALEHVSARQGGAGADEQTLAEFAADAEAQLGLLALQLTQGSYRPAPARLIPVAKPGGGVRELLLPAVRDRIVQSALARYLADLLEPDFGEASHAYRPGHSVATALHRLQALRDGGLVFVAVCDIHHFFDSVDHRRLFSLLDDLPLERCLREQMKTCVRIEVTDVQGQGSWSLARGLAQGSPLSPVLANLFLMAFDAACARAGLALVRYADDCVLACASETEAQRALAFAADALENIGLALNTRKSRLASFAEGFEFLGAFCGAEGMLGGRPGEAACLPPTTGPVHEAAAADDERPPSHGHRPRLRTLYLLENGAVLNKEGERFIVARHGEVLLQVPMMRIDQIMVFGNVQITTPALHECLERGIPVMLLSGRGRFFGVIDPLDARSVPLQRAQFALESDEPARLALARPLIAGKILNCRTFLGRLARARQTNMDAPLAALKSAAQAAGQAADLEILRGIEGAAARTYFAAWQTVLPAKWQFTGRNRQPPTDPVNALLSYGYTIVFYNVLALVRARGLNTHVGVLHDVRPGHPALASDLMEEFRAPVVDAVVMHLVFDGKLQPGDFSWPETPGQPCLMADGSRKHFIHLLEQKLNTTVSHAGQRLDYRRWMDMQVLQYAAALRTPGLPYVPFAIR